MSDEKSPDASGKLFDFLMREHSLKNDAALARHLGVLPPIVSKIRRGRKPVGNALILRIHEHDGVPVARIRKLIAG